MVHAEMAVRNEEPVSFQELIELVFWFSTTQRDIGRESLKIFFMRQDNAFKCEERGDHHETSRFISGEKY